MAQTISDGFMCLSTLIRRTTLTAPNLSAAHSHNGSLQTSQHLQTTRQSLELYTLGTSCSSVFDVHNSRGWGNGAVGKALATQARGPEFNPQLVENSMWQRAPLSQC